MATNPFGTLGFTASFIRGYKDKDIVTIIKAQYRTLSRIHHPDLGGNPATFRKIQQAYEQLEDKDQYKYYKEQFLRVQKDKISDLYSQVAEAQSSTDRILNIFAGYIQGLGAKDNDKIGILNIPRCMLLISDVGEFHSYRRELSRMYGTGGRIPGSTWLDIPNRTYDLEIAGDGGLTKYFVKKVRMLSAEHHNHFKGWCSKANEDQPNKSTSYCWIRTGEEIKLEGLTIVGTIPEGIYGTNQQQLVKSVISTTSQSGSYNPAAEGLSASEFAPLLDYMEPIIDSRRYLVAVKGDQERRFVILGLIMQIHVFAANQI